MTIEELKERSNEVARSFLKPSRDGRGFECPVCGRGDGVSHHNRDRKGIIFKPVNQGGRTNYLARCFSCKTGGDIVDWYMQVTGADTKEAMRVLGVDQKESKAPSRKQDIPPLQEKKLTAREIAEYMMSAEKHEPSKPWRGIDTAILQKRGAVYLPRWRQPNKPTMWEHEVVAIPTSKGFYFVREVNGTGKWDMGEKQPCGLDNLRGDSDVFVVEGAIDSLSLESVGVPAIGLGGTDGMGKLCEVLKGTSFPYRLLLAPDNDDSGHKAICDWVAKLDSIGARYEVMDIANLYGGVKDANDALQADREGLTSRANAIIDREQNPWSGRAVGLLQGMMGKEFMLVPTGIEAIDDLLGGGFQPATLATLGAPPAGGKTLIAQWLMETMAQKKQDFTCLYFCGEMSREQLQARSVSRVLFEHGKDFSALDVLNDVQGTRDGVAMYEHDIAGRVAYFRERDMEIIQGIIQKGVKYNLKHGRPAPYIVIDYLQIMQVQSRDEQERLDKIMGILKDIAVKARTVVIVITSQNRESNKNGVVSMFTGRGSSGIEYGADLCLSLVNTDTLDKSFEGESDDSHKSLVLTKGRFIEKNKRKDFDFDGAHSYFKPLMGKLATKQEEETIRRMFDEPPAR